MVEAAAKRYEREHNARVWLAWHVAALQRIKKLPDLKRMMSNQTQKPRQSWRQQLEIFSAWANHWNAEQQKRLTDGR